MITEKEAHVCLAKLRRIIGERSTWQKDPGNTVHIEESGNCEEKVYLGKALCVCPGSLVFLGGKAFLFGFVTLITKGS